MTFERKIVVGIEDVKSLSLECNKCKTKVTHSPEEIAIPNQCPNPACNARWMPLRGSGQNETLLPARFKLVNAIKEIRKRARENSVEGLGEIVGFRILLEFDESDAR
jgi:hypothetical protein